MSLESGALVLIRQPRAHKYPQRRATEDACERDPALSKRTHERAASPPEVRQLMIHHPFSIVHWIAPALRDSRAAVCARSRIVEHRRLASNALIMMTYAITLKLSELTVLSLV